MSQQERKKKGGRRELREEDISEIPLKEWKLKDGGRQSELLFHSWNTNNHSIVYELLNLYKDKTNKFWIQNVRRALHSYKPPIYDKIIWNKFHELFQNNTNYKEYENASVIILPVLAAMSDVDDDDDNNDNDNNSKSNSLEKSYEIFKSSISKLSSTDKNYIGPSLRSISVLLEICCKNIENINKQKKCIEIGLDLYRISKEYKMDISITTSMDFFDHLFKIFAFNKSSINEFNELFNNQFIKNKNNKIVIKSTYDALKNYFKTIENIEIYENLISDLNGYLFFDNNKLSKLEGIKLPKFELSTIENSEIWEQLRLTQINNDNDGYRERKYDQFIKYMLNDNGAEIIIDGANVGHMIKQQCFSFDFIDHIASYYYYKQNKKIRIIMTIYRIINGENCSNLRVKKIIEKWINNKWLIKVPNALYDDVLWSIYALNSCLIYNGKVIIITNDEMRDHSMALNYKQKFIQFLETKLCRIQIFKNKKPIYYDPFNNDNDDNKNNENNKNNKKRKFDEIIDDEIKENDEPSLKKQKLNENGEINNIQFITNDEYKEKQNFHSKYEYIHTIYPYTLHPPYSYVIKPQFYTFKNDNNYEEFIWFIPHISNISDCQSQQNILKHCYSDWIINKRIRWMVARLKRLT